MMTSAKSKAAIALVSAVAMGLTLSSRDVFSQQPQPAPATASQPQPAPAPAGRTAGIPLRVQVVMSTYQKEKKISSVPYTLNVTAANSRGPTAQIRMGSRVPVPTSRIPAAAGKPGDTPAVMTTPVSFSYEQIGTNIDCGARAMDDGRFELTVSISDSSIMTDATRKPDEPPVFRSFQANTQMLLRDGQTSQFTAASDRVSGEVVQVDVTLNVMK